jgi:hypothetical protein
VSDDPRPHSGSRREPDPADRPVDDDETRPQPAVQPTAGPRWYPPPGRWRTGLLAAAAAGLLLGGGLGGYVIGHATADRQQIGVGLAGDDDGGHGRRGGPGAGGFPGAPDGSGAPGDGTGTTGGT